MNKWELKEMLDQQININENNSGTILKLTDQITKMQEGIELLNGNINQFRKEYWKLKQKFKDRSKLSDDEYEDLFTRREEDLN